MTPYETIKRKRDGSELSGREIADFVNGYLRGDVGDYQMSALLMAIYFQGMTAEETEHLTTVMLESGRVLDLPGVEPPKVDKHSTGGVGDKLSLIVAPVAAACGVRTPMISGRGLGHTGGTLDKLESIPGLRTDLDAEAFAASVMEVGFAIVGQSEDVAPADGRIYALRDVTGTVECVPLIVASILSKKLAAGLDGLVLDVKVGRGAFMPDIERGRELGSALGETAGRLGLPTRAILTDMSAPVGRAVGNALEVVESIEVLRGQGPEDVRVTSLALASAMLELGGVEPSAESAAKAAEAALDDGRALDRFTRFIEAQGGEPRVVDDVSLLPAAPVTRRVLSEAAGFVRSIDALAVGRASVVLGAGRKKLGEDIDPAVGVVVESRIGSKVGEGEPLAVVHARTEEDAEWAGERLLEAFGLGDAPPGRNGPVLEEMSFSD